MCIRDSVKDVIGFIRRLRKAVALADNVSVKLLASETVRVTCCSASEHFGVVQWLERESFQFHTYTLNRTKPVALVLRGLDIQADPQVVLDELRDAGYKVVGASRLYTTYGSRRPLPLIRLLVEKGDSSQALLDLKRLFGLCVSVEPCRQTGRLSQCHRCQRFGHSSFGCRNAPTCVRCGNDHLTQACAVPDNHRYCINCGGAHAANNRRCPVYSEQLDKLKKPVQPKPRHVVSQPVKPAKAAEPVVRKPAPRSAPVPKPSSAVSPSEAPKAKPTIAPPEPEREVPHYTQVPLPDDEEIDPPRPPPPKPRYPRSGKKVRAQAKNTGQPKPPATGPKPVHQKPERPPAPVPAPKASTCLLYTSRCV